MSLPQKGVNRSSRITFTLSKRQEKCFKEDLIEGQVKNLIILLIQLLDIYFELYGELKAKPAGQEYETSILSSSKTPIGIYMEIFDPKGQPFDKPILLASAKRDEDYRDGDTRNHQHRSYHKKAKRSGIHRVCLKAHKSLFTEDSKIKYEMSLQLDGLFEAQYEQKEESQMDNMPKNVVTKENFDKVDLLLDQLESKAEAIISDQAYQRDR